MCGIALQGHDQYVLWTIAVVPRTLEGQEFAIRGEGVRCFLQLSICQAFRLAGAIGADPIYSRTFRVERAKDNVLAVGSPNRAAVGSRAKGQAVRRTAVEIFHPDVVLLSAVHGERQMFSVRREAWREAETCRSIQQLPRAGAIQPGDWRSSACRFSGQVDEDAVA